MGKVGLRYRISEGDATETSIPFVDWRNRGKIRRISGRPFKKGLVENVSAFCDVLRDDWLTH